MGTKHWTDPEIEVFERHALNGWRAVQIALRDKLGSKRTRNGIKHKMWERDIRLPRTPLAREIGACRAARAARVHHHVVTRRLPLMGHDPVAPTGGTRRVDPYAVWAFLRDERTLSVQLSVFSLVKDHGDQWAARAFRNAHIDVREPGEAGTKPRVPLALCEAVTMHGATWRHPMARAWRVALLHNDTTMAPWAAWVAATAPVDPPWMADATADARRFVHALRQQYAHWVAEVRKESA